MDSVFGHAAWLSKELGQPNLSQVMNLWVQELNHAWFNHIYETIYSTTLEWYTVEAWYKGRNGTFESVPYIRLWLFVLPFSPQ